MNEDIESFVAEIMIFLNEEEIIELKDKAGVRFPLDDCSWSDLCYICFWISIKRSLPPAIINRMILGEQNSWTIFYVKIHDNEFQEKTTLEDFFKDFFDLAG